MDIYLLLIISSIIALSYWLEEHTTWAAHISGVFLIIIIAILLSNSGVVPSNKASYDWEFNLAVPIGVSCMLLAFNPKYIFSLKKDFIICFVVGVIGTTLGGILAGILLKKFIIQDYWRISSQLTASFIGGYENAVAVGSGLHTSATVFSKAFAGDSILTSFWIIFNIYQGRKIVHKPNHNKSFFMENFSGTLDVASLAITITIILFILTISKYLFKFFPGMPEIGFISILSTLVTFTPLRSRFSGSYALGAVVLSYFIFACGAISSLVDFFNQASVFLFFPIIIVATHAIILFGIAKICKIESDIAIVVSQCLIGGPATALAVVNARKWNYQFEAVTLGLLGYAIANYFGFAVAKILLNI